MTDEKPKDKESVTVEEVLEAIIGELAELQDARIAHHASMGGLIGLLSRQGIIKEVDLEWMLRLSEDISERMEKARADGLELDAYLRRKPKSRRQRKSKPARAR